MLSHQPRAPARSSLSRLRAAEEKRRCLDAAATVGFEELLVQIADDMEAAVLRASDDIRQRLSAVDARIAAALADLDNDEWLAARDETGVAGARENLDGLLAERSGCLADFAAALEAVEARRAAEAGAGLHALVRRLVDIAARLPNEIERLSEEKALEVNAVVIMNRGAHANLLARMERAHVLTAAAAVATWDRRREDWRRLRHDAALRDFAADAASEQFADPPERRVLFASFRAQQDERQTRRLAVLGALMPSGSLSSSLEEASVAAVLAVFKALHEEEVAAATAAAEGLEAIREAGAVTAAARVEALRHEIHRYAALAPAPDLPAHAAALAAATADPAQEETFRKSGGLRQELKAL
ncbi:unnamed protein product, partial [Phaeothamnion confervicola]